MRDWRLKHIIPLLLRDYKTYKAIDFNWIMDKEKRSYVLVTSFFIFP